MSDHAQSIAAMIREYRSTDRASLLRAILAKHPSASGKDIQQGIDLACRQAESRLRAALQVRQSWP